MNTAIIRLSLVLLLGIIAGYYLQFSLTLVFAALAFSFLLFIALWYRARRILFPDLLFDSSAYLLFFILGMFACAIHLPGNQASHYSRMLSEERNSSDNLIALTVTEKLKEDVYNEKYLAEVKEIDRKKVHGKILLLVGKNSANRNLTVGDQVLTVASPEEIPSPLNPHQFDYSAYMRNKSVLRQLRVEASNFKIQKNSSAGLRAGAEKLRRSIIADLRDNGFATEELAIIQALLLGQKQDISAETYNNYAAAGAIHILAVSGLHVGILLIVFNFLLSPLRRFKKGRIWSLLLLLIILWGFAILAGLSPSVVRAVTMFSFLAVGMHIKRRSSSLNSLFLSLMLLLLINPFWIFEVGFQLSYLAVLAILLLQPLLYRLYIPSTKAGKYLWGLLSTTIAAQAGVLPLSLFYFHQFPGLFFLSNLVILPFLGLILVSGILVILLGLFGTLPGWLAGTYSEIIKILNLFVAEVAQQEQFILTDIAFNLPQVFGFYLVLIFLTLTWLSYTYRKLLFLLVSIIVLQLIHIYSALDEKRHFIIFHKTRESVLAETKQDSLLVYTSDSLVITSKSGLIRNYSVGENKEEVKLKPLKNVFSFEDQLLVRIDSSGLYPKSPVKPGYLLLSGSPRVNLDRVIEDLKPQLIIADGSNFPGLVEKWKSTGKKNNIPLHYTAEDGAFVLEKLR